MFRRLRSGVGTGPPSFYLLGQRGTGWRGSRGPYRLRLRLRGGLLGVQRGLLAEDVLELAAEVDECRFLLYFSQINHHLSSQKTSEADLRV